MAKRSKMSRSKSRGLFTHTAKHAHPFNNPTSPHRGGYRL